MLKQREKRREREGERKKERGERREKERERKGAAFLSPVERRGVRRRTSSTEQWAQCWECRWPLPPPLRKEGESKTETAARGRGRRQGALQCAPRSAMSRLVQAISMKEVRCVCVCVCVCACVREREGDEKKRVKKTTRGPGGNCPQLWPEFSFALVSVSSAALLRRTALPPHCHGGSTQLSAAEEAEA